MKSNCKQVKEILKNHILECIENEGETKKESLENFYNQVLINTKSIPKKTISLQDGFNHTLSGCYASFEYENYKINEFMQSLQLNNNSKKVFTDEQNYNLYKSLLYRESLLLWKHEGIEISQIIYR